MRHVNLRALLFTAAITLSGWLVIQSTPAPAQQSAPIVVGIVDVERIMQDSKAAKSIRTQLDQQNKAFQAEVDRQRKVFTTNKQKLISQQGTLSQADFQKKAEDLNKQGAQIEKNLNQRQNQLEDGVARTRNQVYDAMRQASADVAKDKGLTLVLQKGATLVFDASTEITDDVLKRLDAKMPSVKLQISSGGTSGTTTSGGTSGAATTGSQGTTQPLQGLGGTDSSQ